MIGTNRQINALRVVVATFFLCGLLFAGKDGALTEPQQKKIIDELCMKIESIYPFADIAERAVSGLRDYYGQGKYRDYTDKSEFADRLTVDLEQLSNDTHFYLAYNPGLAAELVVAEDQEVLLDSLTVHEAGIEKWNNYGFRELKILDGVIGYLDLRLFFSPYYAGDVAVAAMNFFTNCNAIIIDLRYNGGGWDDMVNLLLSYFAESRDEVIFNVGQNTLDSAYYAAKTMSYVPGRRFTDVPVYVLISAGTASAAEAFASRIRFINSNALLVGEKTAGAENPISTIVISNEFVLNIPSWRKLYQKYDAAWEVIGVKPDIEAVTEKALAAAHMHALRTLAEAAVEKEAKARYKWALDGVLAIYEPVLLPEDVLQSYSGNYGNRDVYFEDGVLYYQYKKRTKRMMSPVREDYFVVEHYDFFRVRFEKEKGRVTVLEEIFTDGSVRRCTRTSE